MKTRNLKMREFAALIGPALNMHTLFNALLCFEDTGENQLLQ